MRLIVSIFVCVFLLENAVADVALATTVEPEENVFDVENLDDWMPQWRLVGHDTCGQLCKPNWAMQAFANAGVLPPQVATQAAADFAKAEADTKAGVTPNWQLYEVRKGDVVATTFVKNGSPMIFPEIRALFATPAQGFGWTYIDDMGNQYEIFRVVECGNYTVRVVKLMDMSSLLLSEVALSTPGTVTETFYAGDGGDGSFGGGDGGAGGGCIWDCGGGNHPPLPSPVPIPASFVSLLGALLSLFSFGLYVQNCRKKLLTL